MKHLYTLIFILSISFLHGQAVKVSVLTENTSDYLKMGKIGNNIYFSAKNAEKKTEIWMTDGTLEGTKQLQVLNSNIKAIVVTNDTLLFMSYMYDDSFATIFLLQGDSIEKFAVVDASTYNHIHNIGSKLFIPGSPHSAIIDKTTRQVTTTEKAEYSLTWNGAVYYKNEKNLKKFDGTSTIQMKPISGILQIFKISEQKLGITTKNRLWVSNGTPAKTFLVKHSVSFGQGYRSPFSFANIGSNFIFQYYYGDQYKIAVSNGKVSGTFNLLETDIRPIPFNTKNGTYFLEKNKIWKTDGTLAGTSVVDTLDSSKHYIHTRTDKGLLLSQNKSFSLYGLSFFNDSLINVTTKEHGRQTYTSQEQSSFYKKPILITDKHIYLPLLDNDYGEEMHRIDLATGQVEMLNDVAPFAQWSNPYPLGLLGDDFIFVSDIKQHPKLFKIKETAPLQTLPELEKEYDWIEMILPQRTDDSNYSKNHVVTQDGSVYLTLSSHYSGFHLFNNQESFKSNWRKNEGDMPLVKFEPTGAYSWHQWLPVSYSESRKPRIATNTKNEIIAAIPIKGDSILLDTVYTFKSKGDYILAKFSPQGRLIWHQYFDISERVDKVITDNQNNIYITGNFRNNKATFGNTTINSTLNPSSFVAKYSPTGDLLWVKTFDTEIYWKYFDNCYDMRIKNNRLYFIQNSIGYNWFSTCKYSDFYYSINCIDSNTGDQIWKKEIKGDDFGFGTALAVSPNGNLYVAGRFRNEINVDNIRFSTTSCEKNASYILKLNKDGEVIMSQTNGLEGTYIHQLEFDDAGNYYLSGIQDFGEKKLNPGFEHLDGRKTVFLKKYAPTGELINEHVLKGGFKTYRDDDDDRFYARTQFGFAPDGDVILKVNHDGQLDTLNNTYFYPDWADSRVFLVKFNMGVDQTKAPKNGNLAFDDIQLSPNPTHDVLQVFSNDLDFAQAHLDIFSADGRFWKTTNPTYNFGYIKLNVSHLPAGPYFIRVQLGDTIFTKKFVKL